MLITSMQNAKIKKMKQLQKKKYRDKSRYFFVETEHLVQEALLTGSLVELYIDDRYVVRGTHVFRNNERVLENVDDLDGIFGVTSDISRSLSMLPSSSGIFGLVKKRNDEGFGGKMLVLDGVQDPGNVGTMLRSALSFGITDVLATNDAADFYNDKVVRSSQGAIFKLNLVRDDNTKIIEILKKHVEKIFVLDICGKSIAMDFECPETYAIIAGREGEGVRYENWINISHEKMTIPMESGVESLNVSIATSIALYEFSKKRGKV